VEWRWFSDSILPIIALLLVALVAWLSRENLTVGGCDPAAFPADMTWRPPETAT
jgi:hypothetical protein